MSVGAARQMSIAIFCVFQYGYECWCGKADEDFRRHGAGGCDYYCGGDDTTYCGGGWSISVYNTSELKCTSYMPINYSNKDLV